MTDYERERARERVNSLDIRTVYSFTPSKSGLYNCPICGSGTGPKKSGALQISADGRRVTCHAAKACFTPQGEDVLGALRRLWDASEQEVYTRLGIVEGRTGSTGAYIAPQQQRKEATREPSAEPKAYDYTDFYNEARQHLEETDYLQRRGISTKTGARYYLGYVPDWKSPKAVREGKKPPASPRLIIPISANCYLARDTRAEATEYVKMFEGKKDTFNKRALQSGAGAVFVTEGEIDALSFLEVGHQAAALSSAGRADTFIKELEAEPPKGALIIAMDNDEAGKQAEAALVAGLERLHIPYYVAAACGEYGDPNEYLVRDREGFIRMANTAAEVAEKKGTEAGEAYISSSAGHRVQEFINRIRASRPCVPTGWSGVDKILGGGIYTGLYVLGAVSSLGKTTFALQLIDNITAAGNDAIIFSLEMSADELTAKSVSRLTAEIAIAKGISTRNAKDTRGILSYERYQGYSREESALIMDALTEYENRTRGRLWISEGIGNIGVEQIRERVQQHISFTGRKPVILIDYLQILAPATPGASDKQNTDKAVLELKRISRDFDIPVIAISSLNRDNYTAPINMAAFKESGAVEYGSDVLIGLQYEGMDYQEGETDGNRQKRIRALLKEVTAKPANGVSIQLKILKNRNGERDREQLFTLYPLFSLFREK